MAAQPSPRRAAVIGASGYIGTHLVPRLVAEGWQVTASSRNTEVLAAREWQGVELVQADILDQASLEQALAGADVVFYLVHCMAAGGNFAELERQGATNLVAAANAAGVSRIVYLGGLSPEHPKSQHLQARLETGRILREADSPVVELQAGMIVGPGSAAWEVIRDLVNYL
ncbi:MAG: NAD(P)H-binding protein, partial [Pseudomonadota bacterium]